MDNQYSFDKNAVDIIISTLENVSVVHEDDYRVFLDGKALGCPADGVYLKFDNGWYALVMRGLEIPFSGFPKSQQRRLEKFCAGKYKKYLDARETQAKAHRLDQLSKNLNTTLTELVKYGK